MSENQATMERARIQGWVFVRLEVENDWEYLTYMVDGEPLLHKPYTVSVKFPDAIRHEVRLTWSTRVAHYSDHGHRHAVTQHIPSVHLMHHGMEIIVPAVGLLLGCWQLKTSTPTP